MRACVHVCACAQTFASDILFTDKDVRLSVGLKAWVFTVTGYVGVAWGSLTDVKNTITNKNFSNFTPLFNLSVTCEGKCQEQLVDPIKQYLLSRALPEAKNVLTLLKGKLAPAAAGAEQLAELEVGLAGSFGSAKSLLDPYAKSAAAAAAAASAAVALASQQAAAKAAAALAQQAEQARQLAADQARKLAQQIASSSDAQLNAALEVAKKIVDANYAQAAAYAKDLAAQSAVQGAALAKDLAAKTGTNAASVVSWMQANVVNP